MRFSARPAAKRLDVDKAGLSVLSGTALYVGALIGPGVLLVPALAVRAAGPASVISWGLLIVLSAPLAIMFAALGVRMPAAGGVAEYVRVAFGQTAGLITGGWFLTAVLLGAPTVAMIGGFYVAAITHSGTSMASCVGLATFVSVLGVNSMGLRASAKAQIAVAATLTVMIALAVGAALPVSRAQNWTPFAPHGWWVVGTASNILVWLFVGWESVAQLTGEFRDPRAQLPRAMTFAFVIIVVLYSGLAIATVGVGAGRHSSVPLATLMAAGLGSFGLQATTVLAVALAMATMNIYIASASRLASALSSSGGLPAWLAGDRQRSVPLRPLLVIGGLGLLLLATLAGGLTTSTVLVRATSACFVTVYAAATAAAVRILRGRVRLVAVPAAVLVTAIALFSSWYLMVPAASAAGFAMIGARTETVARAGWRGTHRFHRRCGRRRS